MLKEEIAQLVKFSSVSSLAPLRSHNGALFYQTTKINGVDLIFGIKMEKSMFSNWRIEVVCFL